MASFLRGKQAGVQKDLSAGIVPGSFAPAEQSRYGINSQISCVAYDPVQSLLAVGTCASKYGPGKIYLFGHHRIHRSFTPQRPSSIEHLSFVANRLISLDDKHELAVWDLASKVAANRPVARQPYAGAVCVTTDPMLDWALVGNAAGDIHAYDLDRERPSAVFRLPNFWREHDARASAGASLLGMQLHPRDIGKLLIAYTHGAVIYSFKQNKATKFFEYKLPAGAPGGNSEFADGPRKPRLSHAVWHPTGTFVVTAHDDGSLVIWDSKDGRVVTARSLYDTKIDQPAPGAKKANPVVPFTHVAWCCKENPDDTGLLLAGGHRINDPLRGGLTFIDLGPTPTYSTSSWDVLANYFAGKRRTTLLVRPGTEVTGFCLLPRDSPHFAGARDPLAVLTSLTSGEMLTLTFPSGYPITATNMLHPSLSFVHPFAQKAAVSTFERTFWLGLSEIRDQGPPLLLGGAETKRRRVPREGRNVVQVAHADGTVRIWDLGHGDELEHPGQLQVDVASAVGRWDDLEITDLHMSGGTGELAVGTSKGEVVVYRWGQNKHYRNDEAKPAQQLQPGALVAISSRAEPSLKTGLLPFCLHQLSQGPIRAIKVSDVGFVAAASEDGSFSIIDMRGPAVIYKSSVADMCKKEKRSSFLGKSSSSSSAAAAGAEWATAIEFGIMMIEDDSYSSIACFVGTNHGHVATIKIVPDQSGGFTGQYAGVTSMTGQVVAIDPIVAGSGMPAAATPAIAGRLPEGIQIHGILVVATRNEVRIFKPATSRGASKSFDDNVLCDAAAVAECEHTGMFALVAVFRDRTVRAYSLPGLKELARSQLEAADPGRTAQSLVTRTGDVVAWTGPSELVVNPVWRGADKPALDEFPDTLINPELVVPTRPTISNFEWVSGTQYVSPTDLDLLIGGPDRPPGKRMMAAAVAEANLAKGGSAGAVGAGAGGGYASARANQGNPQETEGWGDYLSRQLNERSERLNVMGDSMNNLQETSANLSEQMSKFVDRQKRTMILGGITKGLF